MSSVVDSKKKILIVSTSTGWGGLEMNTLKLAREIQKHGWEIHFVVKANSRFSLEIAKEFPTILNLEKTKKYFDFRSASKISKYLTMHSITIIFNPYRPDLDLIAWTKRKSKQELRVIHQQHMQIGIPKKGIIQRMRYKSVDIWISPLEWLKQELLEKTTITEDKIRVIPIGVNVEHLLSVSYSREEAQAKLNCSTSDTLLGVIGRIDAKKSQFFLVQAIKSLRDQGENISLLIVGEPTIDDPKGKEYYNSLIRYIDEQNLSDAIFISGFTNNVAQFYAAIDVFVMSSIGETYGMVTLEAMLSKVPVVGTNSGGTPEILGHGTRGALYDVDNLESFKESYQSLMRRISSGELDLEELQAYMAKEFSLQKEVGGVMEILNSSL